MTSRTLRQETLDHLRLQHPALHRFDDFKAACLRPARQAIRLSQASKSTTLPDWLKETGWTLQAIPWSDNSFWVEQAAAQSVGNHIAHLAGLFYIQEATSMLPVAALCHQRSPKLVLDMAAAPGSKTTQLADTLGNEGLIIANDMSSSRLKMLNANLIRMGVSQYCLMNQDAAKLSNQLPAIFDSILLDAPCGGEGTIRKDHSAWDNWSEQSLQRLSEVQKSLIQTAWSLLAPGGRLVYSTCSLSREENQQVIEALIVHAGDTLSIVPLDDLFPDADKVSEQGLLHIWPEVFDSEGFFVACMEKSSDIEIPAINYDQSASRLTLPDKDLTLIRQYYQDQFGWDVSEHIDRLNFRLDGNKKHVWLAPDFHQTMLSDIRYQRTGIHLCTLINSRKGTIINSHHDWVRSLGQSASGSCLPLSVESCANYFQGKNLSVDTRGLNGEVLLTYLGRKIGIGKIIKPGQVKNLLPRELVHDKAWG